MPALPPIADIGRRIHEKKGKSRKIGAALPLPYTKVGNHYFDFGVVSSLLKLAPGAEELPEPVDCALDFMAFEFMAVAWCFFLWLAMCLLDVLVTLVVVSSF